MLPWVGYSEHGQVQLGHAIGPDFHISVLGSDLCPYSPVRSTLLHFQLCSLPDTSPAWSVTSDRASLAAWILYRCEAKPVSISLSTAWTGASEYEFEIVLDPLENSDGLHAIAEVVEVEVEVKQ